MMLVSVFIITPAEFSGLSRNTSLILVNLLPSIGVAVIATTLAITHARSRQAKQKILEYKPFSVLLVALVAILPLWSLAQNVITSSVGIYSFVPLILVAGPGFVSYVTLRKVKLGKYNKVVWSAISVSILFIAVFVLAQFVSAISNYLIQRPTMETQTLVSGAGFVFALAVWGMYWFKQVKTLR